MIDSTADAAFVMDRSGVIAAWNASAETMFGLSANAALLQVQTLQGAVSA